MTRSLLRREYLWRHISKTRRAIRLKLCIRNAFMAIMTHAKFYFNWLMLTLIFGIWASEPPPRPGERLKRPGLIGLKTVDRCFYETSQFVLHRDWKHNSFIPCSHHAGIESIKLVWYHEKIVIAFGNNDRKRSISISYGQAFCLDFIPSSSDFHAGIILTGCLSVTIVFRFQIIPTLSERGVTF